MVLSVNALTGQYLIVTLEDRVDEIVNNHVSMPSRASTSLLPITIITNQSTRNYMCQCPHGLVPHCYVEDQGVMMEGFYLSVNALTGQYLIVTVPLQKPRFYAVSRACFCRYLSEYSDSSCFSCMLTIWTYLTRYTHL